MVLTLTVVVLVVMLAVTFAVAGTASHWEGGEPVQTAVSEQHLPAAIISDWTGWVDGRDTLLESLSVLPGWALADDTGIPEKFEPGLYQKIQNLVASQPKQGSQTRSAAPPQYYDIVVLVVTHDADGSDISEANKGAVTALLIEAGARNVSAAQTLSFVTASVPVTAINSVSLYGEVFLMGDGQIRLVPAMTRASITVNATSASLDGTNGTGVTVAVIDDGINHPSLNDKTVHVECTNTSCTVRTDLTGLNSTDNSVTHGTGVAQVVAGSAGIAPGASLLDIDTFPGDSNTFYHALDWAITYGADVVNYSVSHDISKVSSCNLSGLVAHHVANEAIHMGMFLVGVAGNGAVVDGMTTYQSVHSPGCGTGVLTVGGIDDRRDDLRMYNDSGRGPVFDHSSDTIPLLKPEIVAPAVLIEVPGYYVTVNEDFALVASGTSFAAPMVAGAAAILLEEDGDLDTRELKAAMLVGADWKGPIPCTSVQFEAANATDDCSHARQPGNQTEANGPGSLGILNNVGFGVLNVEQSLDYVRDGRHIVSDSLGASQSMTHWFKVDDSDGPVKVILSWNHPTELRLNAGSLPSADITIWDLGLEVACPGMDPVAADSARQVNEFVVFMPARAGTCTATVTTDYAAEYALASTGSFVDEGAFVTTWRTTAADKSITLPLVGTDINVDWGDGNTTASVLGSVSHPYAAAGNHIVSISGGLERIILNDGASALKLRSIDQWGNTQWTSMENAFYGAHSMVYRATDVPDLSGVQSMRFMFGNARVFNGNISFWNVSQVTDMSHMFHSAYPFNQPLNNWNVSQVTDMSSMFENSDFNQPLNNWDVSSVTDMELIFGDNPHFNQNISNWDVSSVTNMKRMFLTATAFNQPLNNWDVSSVNFMTNMFLTATAFNQPLNNWDVSSVNLMTNMFNGATNFNQSLNNWNVSSVTSMANMFGNAASFEQNLGNWYVVANATSIARADVPGVVAEISAQNTRLDGHTPTYDIVAGGNFTLFEIVGGNHLNMTSVDTKSSYMVNVTASGSNVFENDNNWRVLNITVTGSANTAPTVNAGTDQTVREGDTVTLSGSATDDDAGDAVESYTWSAPTGSGITFADDSSASTTFTAPAVTMDTPFTITLTAFDGTDYGEAQIIVTVKETSGAFITTWRTTTAGESITLPLSGTDITINWGDGNTTTGVLGSVSHPYAAAGDHTVSISGGLERIILNDGASALKLRSIDQWGDTQWTSMENAFNGARNMVYRATDVPNLSGVRDMGSMFGNARAFTGDISSWNVSQVTDMSHMFNQASDFNQPLNDWNVSQVTDMSHMFQYASDFNQPLNDWNVSQVTDMSHMFDQASDFNQPLNDWNVSQVTDMGSMFYQAHDFNQPLNNWDVSNVTYMGRMFNQASDFNQPLNSWNVSQVTSMLRMFQFASDFNHPLNSWNVSQVTSMFRMFQFASDFNHPLNDWNVSQATDMQQMFLSATSFDQNLGNWYVTLDDTVLSGDLSAAPTVSPLSPYLDDRSPAYSLNDTRFIMDGRTLRFNMANLPTEGEYPLVIAATAKLDEVNNNRSHTRDVTITVSGDPARPFITTWETDAANQAITIPVGDSDASYYIDWGDGAIETDITGDRAHTYSGAGNYTVYISGGFERINLDNGASASKLRSIDQWGDTQWTSMENAFNGARNMVYEATDAPDLSGVRDMGSMFGNARAFTGDLSSWNVSQVTNMNNMFGQAFDFNQPLNNWDVSSVTNMNNMFGQAFDFNQPLNNWDVSAVTSMRYMFNEAFDFNQPLNNWNVSQVTDTGWMFNDATSFNRSLNDWDVSSVTSMERMFTRADNFNKPLNNWDVSSVTSMSLMFSNADNFNKPLNNWDVSSVTTMNHMFHNTDDFNQPLNNWNVSQVTDMSNMFHNTGNFNQPLNGWDVSAVTFMTGMFDFATSFDQNLGSWYVVANATSIARDDVPGVVAEISAQNSHLDGHTPTYDIVAGGNFTLFEIAGGNHLNMTSVDTKSSYMVNVTASGSNVFENDNNWHVLNITVTGSANTAPTVNAGTDQTVREGDTVTLSGSATDDDAGDAVESYTWSAPTGSGITFADDSLASTTFTAPAVTMDTPFIITLTAFDGTDYGEAQIVVTVKETSGAFITTWRTTIAGESITLPLSGTDITINWGDGNTTRVSGSATHAYADPGTHTVSVSGGLTGINMYQHADAPKLLSIDQWGDASWTSFEFAFWGALNMVYNATDEPDLSGVTSMTRMFARASAFTGNLSSWDVSSVSDMSYMFFDTSTFNGNISGWNVSKVTDMGFMFSDATSFNGNISGWDVSKVTDMQSMFSGATSFNGNISEWNVSKVTYMASMFYQAYDFNQPLNDWDVSQVTHMASMFSDAASFNQSLNDWDVSQVTHMAGMFRDAASFNQSLNDWNVSQVTNTFNMFLNAIAFNKPLNDWDISSVTSMVRMFLNATSFDQNLGNWYVTLDGTVLSGDLSAAPTVSPLSPYLDDRSPAYSLNDTRFIMDDRTLRFNMANLPTEGEYPLAITATAKLDEVNNNRSHTRDVTITVSGDPVRPFVTTWETDAANQEITIPVGDSDASYYIDWGDGTIETDITGDRAHTYSSAGNYTVYISGGFERIHLNGLQPSAGRLASIDQWGDISWSSMASAFSGASNMVYTATDTPDLSSVTDMSSMFEYASSFDGDLSTWNVSQVTTMTRVFFSAHVFDLPIGSWDVSKVTDMSSMFSFAYNFDQPLNNWNVSQVTDMSGMFAGIPVFNQPLNNWNVLQVTDMSGMFNGASSFNGDIVSWNVLQVTTMAHMFEGAYEFDQLIGEWDVSKVTNMLRMFYNAYDFDQPLNGWDVSAVTFMTGMFDDASSFDQNLGEWYVTLDPDTIANTGIPGVVGIISAQNKPLRDHVPTYGIVDGPNKNHFEIISGNRLNMTSGVPGKAEYSINVTASGGSIFEPDNNWRVLVVKVSGDINAPSACLHRIEERERAGHAVLYGQCN